MKTYQQVYPSPPQVRSQTVLRPRAADVMNIEYFESAPGTMPIAAFEQHHILINLKAKPMRLENWRGGDHRDFTFRFNEIAITPAGLTSGWQWHDASKCLVVTIAPLRLERFVRLDLELELSADQLIDVPQKLDEKLTQSSLQMLSVLRSNEPLSGLIYETSAREFLLQLLAKYAIFEGDQVSFKDGATSLQMDRILQFIQENYKNPITASSIAGEVGLSLSHFSRAFKKITGDAPHQFLIRYRVERAQEMISSGSTHMGEIAYKCGFSDQSHFTKLFKKHTGTTPTAYLNMLHQDSTKE